MTDFLWLNEAKKIVDSTLNPLEERIKQARAELEKNPTFQFLENATRKYDRRNKSHLNFAHYNPAYDYHTHRLLKRKIQTLGRTSSINILYEAHYTTQEKHPEEHDYTLMEYISTDKNFLGIYGLQNSRSCNCPQYNTTLVLFSMKDQHDILEIKNELVSCQQKNEEFFISSYQDGKIIEELDWVRWDFCKGDCGQGSRKHYLPLVTKQKDLIQQKG